MKNGGHYIVKCSCGKVLQQCRCFDTGKALTVIENGCIACKAKEAEHQLQRLESTE